ncbi:MAG: ROK family transcriptional regulator [Anaerolineae bacterium]|nr:ROK family transcriptional regulator [Anaerolineae bacterium]
MAYSFRTGDQTLVREINLSIILNTLREAAPLSRAQLAARTGLNKTTVSSLVHELTDRQFVREIGYGHSSSGGRPAMMLELNPQAGCIIGVEIGVDFILVILTDFTAHVLWRWQEEISPGQTPETILNQAVNATRTAISHHETSASAQGNSPLLGIGVGIPGLVDIASGVVIFAPNLGWRDVLAREVFTAAFDVPIFMDNDANAAAMGEHYFGAAQHVHDFVYLAAGVGLGGGIVLNGQLYRGRGGCAGEIGHMTILPDGELCNCGNRGCWETLVSPVAVIRRVRQAIESGKPSLISRLANDDLRRISVPLIAQAARAGDEVARQALEETGEYLGIGIANLINAFDPELVVFGGVLSFASDFLLPVIETTIRQRAMVRRRALPQVKVSAHGFDACVMGCVALVLHDILREPRQNS